MILSIELLAVLAGITIAVLAWSLAPTAVTRGDRLALRKQRLYAEPGPAATPAEHKGKAQLLANMQKLLPAYRLQQLENRLGQAGFFKEDALPSFLLAKLALAGAALLVGFSQGTLWALLSAASSFFAPDLWLKRRIQRRQEAITLAMPDAMDMIAVSVEAGLTLDGAFQRFASHDSPSTRELCQEIRLFLKDIQLGRSRREAFSELGTRSGVHDLQLLASALNQADAWGVEMANVMRVQADHLRTRRLQRAEEKAMKAPIQILFPLVFFIFPAIFIVLLGPAALRLTRLFE